MKAIQNQGQVKTVKKCTCDDEDNPSISKQKEIFNKLVDEGLDEITELVKKVNHDDLIYRCKGKNPDETFDKFDNALNLINKIKNGEIKLDEAKNDQIKFKLNLGEIKKRNNKNRSKEPKNALYSIDILYESRKEAIKFYDDYSLMVSEAKK